VKFDALSITFENFAKLSPFMSFLTDCFEKVKRKRNKDAEVNLLSFQGHFDYFFSITFDNFANLFPFMSFLTDHFEKREEKMIEA